MGLREEHGARAEVIAADFGQQKRFRVAHVGVTDQRHVIAERFECAERIVRHQRKVFADGIGGKQVLGRAPVVAAGKAMHFFDADQPHRLLRRSVRQGPARRHHRVEERQRHGRAGGLQEGPTRQVFASDEMHQVSLYREASVMTGSAFFIWNASLLITPRMNADILYPPVSAFFAIARTAGMSEYSTRRPSA